MHPTSPKTLLPSLTWLWLVLGSCAAEVPPDVPTAVHQPHPDWPEIKQWVRKEFPAAPQLTVAELQARLALPAAERPLLIDARAGEEYEVSHLEGAVHASTEDAALALLSEMSAAAPIVVYCSVGYRSSSLTEKLLERGFTNVMNLEGSIFEWANQGLPVYASDGSAENRVYEVHPFNEEWGRLLDPEFVPER